MTIYYNSNDPTTGFDATTVGTLPTGWSNAVGTWAIRTEAPTDTNTHTFGSTTLVDGDQAYLSGIANLTDYDVLFSQKVHKPNAAPLVGGYVRAATAGYTNGYLFLFDPASATADSATILNFGGGAVSGPGTVTGLTSAIVLHTRIRAQGTTIQIRCWTDGNAEPTTWNRTVVDGSKTTGKFGLYHGSTGGVVMTIDNVLVQDIAGADAITVTTPGTQIAGSSFTVSGTYSGTTPTALDVQFDSAGYGAVTGATIGSGVYSFTATAPAAGSHTVSVRNQSATTVFGTSGSFTTTTTAAITVNTPSTQIAGASFTVSGTYSGTAPTALDFQFDSAGYAAVSAPTISGGTYSFTATAPAAGSHTVSVRNQSATTVFGTSGSFTTTSTISVAPNHASIVYSPYTWLVGSTAARTICAGAYFSTLFSGSSCTLRFDVSQMVAMPSQIWYRIDGSAGPWTKVILSSGTVVCTIPASTAGNADFPFHLLEVVMKSGTETANRWSTGIGTAVVFSGLTLDSGATVVAPLKAPKNILVIGDSITEGVRTVGESAANDTDRNDAVSGWAFRLGALLGAEVGVVGFGATGINGGGSGGVPAFASSYGLLYGGASRSFAIVPDLIVLHVGTNDYGGDTTANMTALLNGLIAASPTSKIAVLRPFTGTQQTAFQQAAIAACTTPSACTFVDTAGFYDTSKGGDSLSLHPNGSNNLALIAPQIAATLKSLVWPPTGGATATYRGGFQRSG